jgi:class 3 adenylate cyclase
VGGGFAEWLWRRHRQRYAAALITFCGITLLGGLVIPAAGVACLYLGFTLREAVCWTATLAILDALGVVVGCWIERKRLAPLFAWASGDFSDPQAAWESATSSPPEAARMAAEVITPLSFFVSVPLALYFGERTWLAAVGLVLGMSAVIAFAGLMYGNGLHVLLRPCTDEIEQVHDITHRSDYRDWTLRSRLALAFGTATALPGIGITAITLGTRATAHDFLIAAVAGAALAGYLIFVTQVGLVKPVASSIEDLIAAVKRVRSGDFSHRVPVTTVDELGDLAMAFNDMQAGMREREALRAAFGSYVDPALAQRLLTQGTSTFAGEDVDVTVFFADVRGFTAYVESATAPEAVARLNQLFEILVPVIQEAGGHANHYLGDGLLAVFGTPTPLHDHAARAVGCAIEIQRQVRLAFDGELRIGVGVNTGRVTAGTIGGGGRLEFTVIGDAVNIASRLERMTRETGDAILVTQATLDAIEKLPCRAVSRGDIELRGKSNNVCVHALVPSEF